MQINTILKKIIFPAAPLLFLAIGVLYLSYNVIYTNDSITYQYSFATGERINSLIDIFPSQYAHYFSWNGRTIAHFICQIVLALMHKGIYAVLNAIAYVLLVIGIIKVAKANLDFRNIAFTSALVLFSFNLDFAPNYQISYIWMGVLILLYLYIFRKVKNIDVRSITTIALFLFSVFAGNAHEVFCIGVGGSLIIFTLRNIHSLNKAQWVMIIGFGIGGIFLCLSPASIRRSNSQHIPQLISLLNFILNFRSLYILILLILYKIAKHEIAIKEYYLKNAFLINAILILLLFNVIIGVGNNGQLIGIELFSSILILHTISLRPINSAVVSIALMVAFGIFSMKVIESDKSKKCYDRLYAAIMELEGDKIYIDFPQFNTFFMSGPVFRNGVYLDYIISSIQTVQMGSLTAPKKDIKVYPSAFKDIEKQEVKNQVLEYLPGEFMLMQDKSTPATFTLSREISFFGLGLSLPDLQVSPSANSELNTEDYNIMYLPNISPLIRNKSVAVNKIAN